MGLRDWFKGKAQGQDFGSAGSGLFHSGREKEGTRREKIKTITIPAEIRAFTTGTMCFFSDGSYPDITVRFDAYRNEEKAGWDIRRFVDVPEGVDIDPAVAAAIPPGQGDFFNGRAPCDFDALRFLSEESAGRGFRVGGEDAGHYDMPHWKDVAKAAKQPIDNAGIVQPVVAGQVLADNVIFDDPAQIAIRDSTRSPAIVPAAQKPASNTLKQIVSYVPASSDSKALIEAARKGNIESVHLLIGRGADVNAKIEYGNTALYLAVQSGHTQIVRMLIDAGADVDTKTENEWVALHYAAGCRYTEIVRLLIDAGADVNAKNKNGKTARDLAQCEGHIKIVNMLDKAAAGKSTVEFTPRKWGL